MLPVLHLSISVNCPNIFYCFLFLSPVAKFPLLSNDTTTLYHKRMICHIVLLFVLYDGAASLAMPKKRGTAGIL